MKRNKPYEVVKLRKTSEWITELQKMIEERGDLDLCISAGGYAYYPMELGTITDGHTVEILIECYDNCYYYDDYEEETDDN